MRNVTLSASIILCVAGTSLQAATVTQRDAQALALAGLALQALNGASLSDATLQGTANFTAGSDEDSGTFTVELKGNQESKAVLNLSGGTRQEVRNAQSGGPQGVWIGADGQKHTMALHNCWTDASTLATAFTLQDVVSDLQTAASYLGQATWNGITVDHLQFSHIVPGQSQQMTAEIQALSAIALYLDATSHLPVALDFNIHPDNDLSLNIPVEIQFSNYQQVKGVSMPTHIQKLIQGTLTLDLTITRVTTNSGLLDSEFSTR